MSDFIEKLLRKGFFILVNALLAMMGIVLCFVGAGGLIMGEPLLSLAAVAAGLGLSAFGTRWFWYPAVRRKHGTESSLQDFKPASLAAGSSQAAEFTQECYDKAVADYNRLNSVIRSLEDAELCRQLEKMQDIAGKMLLYMKENPDRISLAERFINYYQDRAVVLSSQFLEFEQMKLETPEITEIKAKTKRTLAAFDEAYTAQFSSMLSNKVMEIESELKVAEQIMSDAGIQNQAAPETASPQPAEAPDFRIERPFDTEKPDAAGCGRNTGCRHKPRGRFQR